jgi:CRISPR/Cas system-associated exonuclease Cas4 (RecB family)
VPISEVVNDGEWPQEFVDLVIDRDRNDVKNIHVTDLSGCLRQAVLRISEPYVVYTSKMYPLLRGILMHAGIEALLGDKIRAQGGVVEAHVKAKIGNTIIAGTMDYRKDGVIKDWKVPLRSKPPSDGYIQQLNVYNWLLTENGYEAAEELELVAFEPSKLRSYPIPRWSVEYTKQRIQNKLNKWTGELPPPEGIELGYCKYCPVVSNCFEKEDMVDFRELLENIEE